MSFKERTDVTAVPAMGVVAETMVALVLADEVLRKFGGDSVGELVRNHDAYREQVRDAAIGPPRPGGRRRRSTTPAQLGRQRQAFDLVTDDASTADDTGACARAGHAHVVLVGMMGSGKTSVGRRLAARLGLPFVDSDRQVEARTGRTVARDLRDRRRGRVPRSRSEPSLDDALGRAGAVGHRRRRRRRSLDAPNRDLLRDLATAAARWCGCGPTRRSLADRVDSRRPPAAAGRRPRRARSTGCTHEREPLYRRGGRHRRRRARAAAGSLDVDQVVAIVRSPAARPPPAMSAQP